VAGLGLVKLKLYLGKTSLLKFILKNPDLLYEKFDEILILSPSAEEWGDLFLPKENVCDDLSW
jgi:hypothetical protein